LGTYVLSRSDLKIFSFGSESSHIEKIWGRSSTQYMPNFPNYLMVKGYRIRVRIYGAISLILTYKEIVFANSPGTRILFCCPQCCGSGLSRIRLFPSLDPIRICIQEFLIQKSDDTLLSSKKRFRKFIPYPGSGFFHPGSGFRIQGSKGTGSGSATLAVLGIGWAVNAKRLSITGKSNGS
jgi:hypothetical protein